MNEWHAKVLAMKNNFTIITVISEKITTKMAFE